MRTKVVQDGIQINQQIEFVARFFVSLFLCLCLVANTKLKQNKTKQKTKKENKIKTKTKTITFPTDSKNVSRSRLNTDKSSDWKQRTERLRRWQDNLQTCKRCAGRFYQLS